MIRLGKKRYALYTGDALDVLGHVPDGSVQCVVTSPPYWGLRDYGTAPLVWGGDPGCDHGWGETLPHGRRGKRGVSGTGGNLHPTLDKTGQGAGSGGAGSFCGCGAWRGQLGLEPTPDLYVSHLVRVFGGVRRALADDGVLWVNLGDSYAHVTPPNSAASVRSSGLPNTRENHEKRWANMAEHREWPDLKPKDLVGMPWRLAFALQADGWYLRSDVVWAKPNPMPESVKDRPTRSHESMFLFAKSVRYYYDHVAVSEPAKASNLYGYTGQGYDAPGKGNSLQNRRPGKDRYREKGPFRRNKRDVWTITVKPFKGAHFATFPIDLVEPCVLAGSRPGDVVLDPFSGAGTTGVVAVRHGRRYLGIDLKREYNAMAHERLQAELNGGRT